MIMYHICIQISMLKYDHVYVYFCLLVYAFTLHHVIIYIWMYEISWHLCTLNSDTNTTLLLFLPILQAESQHFQIPCWWALLWQDNPFTWQVWHVKICWATMFLYTPVALSFIFISSARARCYSTHFLFLFTNTLITLPCTLQQ